jgi:hypothetical protein
LLDKEIVSIPFAKEFLKGALAFWLLAQVEFQEEQYFYLGLAV